MTGLQDRTKSLLCDLGKATMRGVRKCSNCGTFNGTRCVRCKNKACGLIFKVPPDTKDKRNPDAVKILTDSDLTFEIYSVRLRDGGPDFRSFVQLPLLSVEANAIEINDKLNVAKCYTEMCNSLEFVQDLSSPDFLAEQCRHVKSALQCINEAQPLTLKNSVLNSLSISNEIKQAIWMLATDSTGPLVQRVSKNTMVVKCKKSIRQPLGYVHFTFVEVARFNKTVDFRFHCSCRSFKVDHEGTIRKREMKKKCVHYYACVCAFASYEKLAEEFDYYVKLETNKSDELVLQNIIGDSSDLRISGMVTLNVPVNMLGDAELNLSESPIKRSRNGDLGDQVFDMTMTSDNHKKKRSTKLYVNKQNTREHAINEASAHITFCQWLAGITERIYETMHYQFDGNPEALVFLVPNLFFDCLEERFSVGCKKRRLPNSTTVITRSTPPLGTYIRYCWQITNIIHVKQIFDSPLMPFEICRNFSENRDGTYEAYEPPCLSPESRSFNKIQNRQIIKPLELKTFLKVGRIGTDGNEITPFIIEWIPDVFPKSKIGELTIRFQFGHQRNGQIETKNILVAC